MNKQDYLKELEEIYDSVKDLEREKRTAQIKYIEANKIMCVDKKYLISFNEKNIEPIKGLVSYIEFWMHKKTPRLIYHFRNIRKDGKVGKGRFLKFESQLSEVKEIV